MFKVKYKYTGDIYTVLDVKYDEYYQTTRFLMWVDNKWTWVRADNFVPPNVNIDSEKSIKFDFFFNLWYNIYREQKIGEFTH